MKALITRLEGTYPVRLARAFLESNATNFASGLAFNMFVSMFPLLLGLLAILGLVVQDPRQLERVELVMLTFFPPDAQSSLQLTLRGVRNHAGLLGLLGVGGLIWSGSNLFTGMEFALCEVFGTKQRGFVGQRLMSLLMTAVFAMAVVIGAIGNALLGLLPRVPLLGPILGAVVWVILMLLIYRVVPNGAFTRLRDVWPGALLAGVLMEALSLLWPLYTWLTHRFDTYGSTFALFLLLATWLYFLSQLILLGAIANRLRLGTPDQPTAAAAASG